MCDPATVVIGGITLGEIATGVAIGGTVLATASAFNQSQAVKDQTAYQAAIARNNQVIAERKAANVETKGRLDVARQRLKVRQLMGRQTVALAGQGVDVTSEGEVNLLAETAELGELDAQTIRVGAAQDAAAVRAQGANFGAQATLLDAQSRAQNPLLAAGTTALTGFGSISAQWYKQTGGTGG
jgi:hypothetical protein